MPSAVAPSPPPELFEEDEETARRLDDEAIAEMEAQGSISWEAVKRWMLSWGKPDELPPPQVGD